MSHLKLPQVVTQYITNLYSKLQAFVHTKEWSSSNFSITRGVFQGDTMSPIIFLMAFNPVLKLAEKLACPGFTFKFPVADSEDLPACGSTIAVLWDEPDSDERSGWYKCLIA